MLSTRTAAAVKGGAVRTVSRTATLGRIAPFLLAAPRFRAATLASPPPPATTFQPGRRFHSQPCRRQQQEEQASSSSPPPSPPPAAADPDSSSASASASSAASASSSSTAAALPASSHLYTSFSELGLPAPLVARLSSLGVRAPTLIQQRVIPFLQRYRHTGVLLQAPTGTGKSLAFLLPVLANLLKQRQEEVNNGSKQMQQQGIQAVIMCPTQELAMQTHAQLHALLAAPGAPPPPHLGTGTDSFVALCVGGFESVAEQRAHLLAHPPCILVGTPKRLNSLFFPQYETHGRWQEKRRLDDQMRQQGLLPDDGRASQRALDRRTPRQVLVDPPEDEGAVEEGEEVVPEWEWDALLNGEQGKGESHGSPHYDSTLAKREAAMDAEYRQRNNVALAAGGSRADQLEHDRELDEDDADDDEVDELFLPPRYAVGYEAQKFLLTRTRLARARVNSPLKRIFQHVQYLVIDEADEVLQPLSKYAGKRERENRMKHPKPSNIFVRGLTLLNPTVQLVAASATINARFRILVARLGFRRPKPVHIRIAARPGQEQSGMQSAAVRAGEVAVKQAMLAATTGTAQDATTAGTDANAAPSHPPVPPSSSLTSTFPNAVATPQTSAAPAIPLSQALMYHIEVPENIKHFYVFAPPFSAWKKGQHAEPPSFPTKLPYDFYAPEEERQAVHLHNLKVTQQLRNEAFVLDKICSLRLLLGQYRPKAPLLVVDDTKHSLSHIAAMCEEVDLRPTLLYHHLSTSDPTARARFFEEVEQRKYDILLVSLSSVRGLDLPQCDLVVTLDVIREPAQYAHAAGRTGRLGRVGSVINLLHPEEHRTFELLARYMPETLTSAQQILLPRALAPQLHRKMMAAYEAHRAEIKQKKKDVEQHIKNKMKRQVVSDVKKMKMDHVKKFLGETGQGDNKRK